jgi:hypothetical protein
MALVWQHIKPYLLGFLVVLVVAGAIWALIYVPKMEVPVCPPGKAGLPPKICFDIENEARKTLAYIMGGLLAIIGITLAYRRIRALERQVLVGQESQITERFTRAIEQLGCDRMEVRLGGIYALERIANDSDKDYWTIMETLTAYIRENAPWREPRYETPKDAAKIESTEEETARPALAASEPSTDIQAALTVLGRRKYGFGHKEEKGRLDLRETNLSGANLEYAHLEGADLRAAHLEEAELLEIHLEGANLRHTHLEGAELLHAHLEGAGLHHAHLERANLFVAHLEGANLQKATGITRKQLTVAFLNENTILPDYLQDKRPEAKGAEGKNKE